MHKLDLPLASSGYLRDPAGHIRHILALEDIARDLELTEAQVYWDVLSYDEAAYSYPRNRIIVLATWLIQAPPWYIRRIVSHELLHLAYGHDEDRIERHQLGRYGDLIVPMA